MSTRSVIGILHTDGSIAAHYCHSDGYFSYNGRMLHENYQDRAKIQRLIDLGMMSILREEIGEKHDFDWHSAFSKKAETIWGTMSKQERAKYAGTDGKPNQYAFEYELRKQQPEAKMSMFFGRDRGEKDVGASRYDSLLDLVQSGALEEYLYLYDEANERWVGCESPRLKENDDGTQEIKVDFYDLAELAKHDFPDTYSDDWPADIPTTQIRNRTDADVQEAKAEQQRELESMAQF